MRLRALFGGGGIALASFCLSPLKIIGRVLHLEPAILEFPLDVFEHELDAALDEFQGLHGIRLFFIDVPDTAAHPRFRALPFAVEVFGAHQHSCRVLGSWGTLMIAVAIGT